MPPLSMLRKPPSLCQHTTRPIQTAAEILVNQTVKKNDTRIS
ncbi:hypothetical protein AWB67_01909 [Caballeronia terrestris]|jgi:hypothetical protein|uniref:Uncharacterized protein n=1 Tax=Caballeronia terrestris TaxID=1226301 RepID=A0A158HMU9_9BURK|nr:hypothetical protein AWB67_01909 [Caballeronia terrestris]